MFAKHYLILRRLPNGRRRNVQRHLTAAIDLAQGISFDSENRRVGEAAFYTAVAAGILAMGERHGAP